MALGALLGSGMPNANAAVLDETTAFSNIMLTVDKSGDLDGDNLLDWSERLPATLSFDVADSVQSGDEITIVPSPYFKYILAAPVDLSLSDGTVIGKVLSGGGGLKVVFNDNINNLQKVSASFTVPLGISSQRSAKEGDLHDIYVTFGGTEISSNESISTPVEKRFATSGVMSAVADTSEQVGFDLALVAQSTYSTSTQPVDITYVLTKNSDNWEFDPNNISLVANVLENGYTEDGGEKAIPKVWTDYTIDSATKDSVTITVHNVPAEHASQIHIKEGITPLTIDGNDYAADISITNINGDGATRSFTSAPATATSASGMGTGETIAPNFTFEALVAGKDADTAADAVKTTAPAGATSVTAPVTLPITNTGNVPLFNPVITGSDGSSVALEGVTIPVGGSYTAELGDKPFKVGENVVTYTVKANGIEASDPVVVIVDSQKVGDVIAKFVDQDGKDIKPPVTVADDVAVGESYDSTKNKTQTIPGDGFRYELVKVTGSETGKVTEGTTTITYTYQKVANWVPQIPGVDLPAIPYPFTPDGGVGEGVIPHVGGFVPVDPVTGEPLKPVDPEDPTKGYIAPKPGNPGENTVINYIPVGTPDDFTTNQGEPVTVVPSGNDGEGFTVGGLVDPGTGEKVTEVTVPGEGTYVLNEDGSVVFTPEDGFTGKTTPIKYIPVKNGVEGQPVDINGFVKPIGSPDTFTTEEGEPITIIPADNDGKGTKPGSLIDPKTGEKVTEVTVPGEGTYVLNEDGSVVFTPEDGFTGKTTPVQYIPVNEAGDEGDPVAITGEVTAKPAQGEPKVEDPAAPAPTREQVVNTPAAPAPAKAPAATQTVEVQSAAPASAPTQAKQATAQKAAQTQLAYTGAGVGALAGIGGLLTAAGAFLARRRKNQD